MIGQLLYPRPVGRPSVSCLDLTQQQKGLGSPKSAEEWKSITRVTREPEVKSQGHQAD